MLLPHTRGSIDYGAVFRLLKAALTDPKERVKQVGLEGVAVLAKWVVARRWRERVCARGRGGRGARWRVAGEAGAGS